MPSCHRRTPLICSDRPNMARLTNIDLSGNDLSGFNTARQRQWLASLLRRLVNLEELRLDNVKINGETALLIVENVDPGILELSLANNDLTSWNLLATKPRLERALNRINDYWSEIHLANTELDDNGAASSFLASNG